VGDNYRNIHSYYNTGKRPSYINSSLPSLGLANEEVIINDGKEFTCSFDRLKSVENQENFYSLDQDYYILFAYGSINDTNDSIKYHKSRTSTSAKYNLGTQRLNQTQNESTSNEEGIFTSGPYTLKWSNLDQQTQFSYSVQAGSFFKANDLNDYYVAFGFSTDTEMGDDNVVCCTFSNSNNNIEHLYNRDKSRPDQLVSSNAAIGITEAKISSENGILQCSFKREKFIQGVENYFDLTKSSYHLLLGLLIYSCL
jgi:hypothetical protein